jgi:hypothetical protein
LEEEKESDETTPISTIKVKIEYVSTPETTEATLESQEESQEDNSKYCLLNRLFRFVSTKERPVNSVLAGYFSKLLLTLLSRKQH